MRAVRTTLSIFFSVLGAVILLKLMKLGQNNAILAGCAVLVYVSAACMYSYIRLHDKNITGGMKRKITVCALFGLAFAAGRFCFLIQPEPLTEAERRLGGVKWTLLLGLLIFLCWLPYLISYYPGLIYGDSLSSVGQALGKRGFSNHHPIAYTMFIKLCLAAGYRLRSMNFGCAIYTAAQMLYISMEGRRRRPGPGDVADAVCLRGAGWREAYDGVRRVPAVYRGMADVADRVAVCVLAAVSAVYGVYDAGCGVYADL